MNAGDLSDLFPPPCPEPLPGRENAANATETPAFGSLTVNHRPKVDPWADQLAFWAYDTPLTRMAQTRNASGDFFEQATASLVGGVRLRTNGNSQVCPDVLVAPGVYAESKGVGRSGGVIVYEWRRAKDIAWTAEHGATLLYAIWHHGVRCTNVATVGELRAGLASGVHEVLLIPAATLYDLCGGSSRVINTASRNHRGNGYGCERYKRGWSIRLTPLRAACDWTGWAWASAFGERFAVTVHTSARLSRFLYRPRP